MLRGQEAELGNAHPHTLQTRSSLAADLRALGKYRQALTLDQTTYDSWVQDSGFGEDYGDTLSAANNLALSNLLNGRYRDALRGDRLTLKRRTTLFRPGHPRTLHSGTAVARDLIEDGQYREAAGMLADVATQAHRSLGDDARITLNARLWLGVAQRCAGDPEWAAENIAAAKTGLTRGFGPDSNDALASRLSEALNQLALGQVDEGRKDPGRGACRLRRVAWDGAPAHADLPARTLPPRCASRSRYADALVPVERAANGLSNVLSPIHTYTLSAKLVWASVLAHLGKLADAAELEEAVLAERTQVARVRITRTPSGARLTCLLTRRQQGANGQAIERQQVISRLGSVLGDDHPDVTAAGASRRLFSVVNPQPF